MTYHYSDPAREHEPHALPNVEVWQAEPAACRECAYTMFTYAGLPTDQTCPECATVGAIQWEHKAIGGERRLPYWYAFGFPGCLWDGEPMGPFETEEEALADAREGI